MGLDLDRDRLCVVQLSPGDGSADVVQIPPHVRDAPDRAPNLKRLLADKNLLKIFHFARFDLGMLYKAFGVMPEPVYCTKIASRLSRTYTDKHGLKDLVREVLGQDLSKQQQSSDWGAPELTEAQVSYAAADVTHLHALKDKLDAMLAREGREALAARLLPLSAGPGAARPRRLCRRRYFCPFLNRRSLTLAVEAEPGRSHIRRQFSGQVLRDKAAQTMV